MSQADAIVSKLQTSADQEKDVKPSILIASDTVCISNFFFRFVFQLDIL